MATAPAETGAEKRRCTRVVRAVPITVIGMDALGQMFREQTTTVVVDCYGCKYESKNYAPKDSIITLEIPPLDALRPGRTVRGRVVWVQRPRSHREQFQIALELEVAGNVWGVAPAPRDWFAHPDDDRFVAAVPDVNEAEAPPAREPDVEILETVAEVEEVTFTRQHLDGKIQDAIAKTVRAMAEQVAEAAVRDIVQDLSERTARILEEVRKVSGSAAEELDAKIRQLLDEAVSANQIELPRPQSSRRRRRGNRRGG
jgi:hypothetical protein